MYILYIHDRSCWCMMYIDSSDDAREFDGYIVQYIKGEIASRTLRGRAMSCIFNVTRNVHVGTMFRATHACFCEPFASVNYKATVVKSMKAVTFALSTSSPNV